MSSTAPLRRHDASSHQHSHAFMAQGGEHRQHALGLVAVLTLVTMVVELVAGYASGSLALTADGWHMGSHAGALGGAWLAARLARQAHDKAHYAFGGWKIEVLAGYSSALLLAGVALALAIEGVQRLLQPQPVAYVEAMVVALLGLAINVASAWLLSRGETHGHDHHHHHGHGHGHHDHHHDHNFRAAYLHVVADAVTSVLAIAALAAGLWWQIGWADAVVGLVAAVVIGRWALGLLKETAKALVDATSETALRDAVRAAIEADRDAQVTDLHIWQVGPQAWSAALSLVADAPLPAEDYRRRLAPIHPLRHITVEVHRCQVGACCEAQAPR
jgi:cation diffusion facilitator family transporter